MIFLIFLIAFFNVTPSNSQISKNNYGFANELFFNGDYVAALNEYKRLYFYSTDEETKRFFCYWIGICYLKLGRYNQTRSYLKYAMDSADPFIRYKSLEGIIASYNLLGEYTLAASELEEYITVRSVSLCETEYLRGILYFYQMDFHRATNKFKKVLNQLTENETLNSNQKLNIHMKNLYQYSKNMQKLPRRSPVVASLLSTFLPGSGQVYTGQYLDGIIAFFLNTATMYSVYSLVGNRHYLSATMLFLLGINFWSTNVNNAYNFAVQHNTKIYNKYLMEPFNWNY